MEMVKRVAMISFHTCPLAPLGGKETGGMNVYIKELSRELGRRGIAVDVFTRLQDPGIPRIVHLGKKARIIHLKAGPEAPYNKNQLWKYLPQFLSGIIKFAEDEKITYSLIHCHYWLSGEVGVKLRERWKIPLVQMFHTLGHPQNAVIKRSREKAPDVRLEIERRIMNSANRIIAASLTEKAQMIWYYGAKPEGIEVIPCGVDVNLFKPIPPSEAKTYLGLPSQQKLILFVGRIISVKGIDILLKAMALVMRDLQREKGDVRLFIIGGRNNANSSGDEMVNLRNLASTLGLNGLITFIGPQRQHMLPYFYSASDVCVFPSRYESFGMVALEAMACGTPVIASKVGGFSFTVQDGITGFLVPEETPEILAQKIKVLLMDQDLRQKLGSHAHLRAKGFRWSVIADHIVSLYNTLIISPDENRKLSVCT